VAVVQVVGVYEQVVWPQCVKTRCQGRRVQVGDTARGCLSAGGGEVNELVLVVGSLLAWRARDSTGNEL